MRRFGRFWIILGAVVAPAQAQDVVADLERATRDTDRGVRYAAVQALGKARAGWPSVRARMDDPVWCVRQAAGAAAQQFGVAVLDDLTRIARTAPERAAIEATEALGLAGPAGARVVATLVADPRHTIVLTALDALFRHRAAWPKNMPWKRIEAIEDGDDAALRDAAMLLLQHRDVEVEPVPARTPLPKLPELEDIVELPAPLSVEHLILLGEYGVSADDFAERIHERLQAKSPRVRAAAVWALGRMGIETPDQADDDHPVVRELALATMKASTAKRLLANGSVRERRLAARMAADASQLEDDDVVVRIEAALRTGRGLDDPERDVRMAAALTSGAPSALDDSSARVKAAALARISSQPEKVAPLLTHGDPSISHAACQALIRMRSATHVAPMLADAHYGVLHYAPSIFEAAGRAARATVPTLVALLSHTDVNVRETAARCLGSTRSVEAAPALIAALRDERLSVVATAAFSLAHIGPNQATRDAMRSEHARTRAYAVWAIGQWLADDPAPYAPRLPVLDVGREVDVPARTVKQWDEMERAARIRACRQGVWSSDPRVAIPCAAALDIDDMGPIVTERCIELLAPEGVRVGSPVDLERYRSYLGPRELPATLEYVLYSRDTDPSHKSIYGELHRSPSSDEIPALLWLRKRTNHRTEKMDELWQPFGRSARFPELRGFDRLWDTIERTRHIGSPAAWWLQLQPIPPERTDLLAWIAHNGPRYDVFAALRLLGRTPGSRAWRRLVQFRASAKHTNLDLATAALARHGHPLALFDLYERSQRDAEVLGMLLECRPRLAVELLRQRLPDAEWARRTFEAVDDSYFFGTRIEPHCFLGLAPTLNLGTATYEALTETALKVPGCATLAVANAAIKRLRESPPEDVDWSGYPGRDPAIGWLALAKPEELTGLLREWTTSANSVVRDFACACLFTMGDSSSVRAVAAWIGRTKDDSRPEPYEVPLQLRTPITAPLFGFERWPTLVEFGAMKPAEIIEVLRGPEGPTWCHYQYERGSWVHAALDEFWTDRGVVASSWTLIHRALWPDTQARADLWSIYRAGRYRWIVYRGEEYSLTLGRDLSTIPYWIDALESNCCVISGQVEGLFERYLGFEKLYSAHTEHGQPPSERARMWMALYGGDLRYHPTASRFLPLPD